MNKNPCHQESPRISRMVSFGDISNISNGDRLNSQMIVENKGEEKTQFKKARTVTKRAEKNPS